MTTEWIMCTAPGASEWGKARAWEYQRGHPGETITGIQQSAVIQEGTAILIAADPGERTAKLNEHLEVKPAGDTLGDLTRHLRAKAVININGQGTRTIGLAQ